MTFQKAPEELSIGDYVKVTDTRLFEGLTEEELAVYDLMVQAAPLTDKERNQVKASYNRSSKMKYLEEKKELMQWWAKWLDKK